jgi:hypothetical protein
LQHLNSVFLVPRPHWRVSPKTPVAYRVSTKNISIIVPQGTAAAFISLGPWEFHFGPRGFLRERPLGELLISFGITGFTGRQLDVDVTTRLTDINADDPWEADVRINALCFA